MWLHRLRRLEIGVGWISDGMVMEEETPPQSRTAIIASNLQSARQPKSNNQLPKSE